MSEQKKILLIDDEIDLQQLVKMALKSKDYHIETANNGLEGLEKLQTFQPDLIILDMNMPKMGGVEFYQKICVNNKPTHPVLVLTARANMEQLFREFNIDGFMAKPFEVDQLLEEVDAIIHKHSGISQKTQDAQEGPIKICIADNDRDEFNQISLAFLNENYAINPAHNGTEAIDHVSSDVPHVALIKLGLVDIAGDMVIAKLKHMAKTERVKYILYTNQTGEKESVTEQIAHKASIDRFVAYSSPQDLLDAVTEVLA